ncbi:MAG TPA: penicillin-binding protein activator [Candidatus Manganitrophaceae bacterium]|nr:penicillin-binding protein activator [Candidatus Manganitrophaceae bacterium]
MRRTFFMGGFLLVLILSSAALIPGPSLLHSAGLPDEKTLLEQARTYSSQGNQEQALASLEQLLLNYPNSPLLPDVYLQFGEIYTAKGEMKRAAEVFKTFLERFPKEPRVDEVRLKLSDAYLALDELKESFSLWKDLPGEEGSKIAAYDKLVEAYSNRNDYFNAVQVLMEKKSLLIDPEANEKVRADVAAIVKGKLQEKELQSIVKQFGENFPSDEAILRLISQYHAKEDYFREEREIKQFLSLFPAHPAVSQVRTLFGEMKDKIKSSRYLVAVVLPLSGKLASFGNTALNGAQLAVQLFKESLPGASVGLIVKDLEEEPASRQSAFESWLEEYRPIAAVGPLLSKEVDRVAPILEKAGLFLITPGATATRLASLGNTVFRNAVTYRSQCAAIAQYAVSELTLKQFAILFPKESLGAEWVKCFSEEVAKSGGEIVHAESYPLNDTDFSQTIRRLKEADLKKNGVVEMETEGRKKRELSYTPGFQAIFLPADAQKAGLIIPQLVFHNIKGVMLLGSSGWNAPEFLKLVNPYAEGATFVDGFFQGSPDPAVRKFVAQYRAKFQQDPDLFAAQAFDATRLILAALEGGATTSRDVKAFVANTKNYPGASGLIYEVRDGEFIKKPFFIQVQKGKLVQIN